MGTNVPQTRSADAYRSPAYQLGGGAYEIAGITQNGTPREIIRLFREKGHGTEPLLMWLGKTVPKEGLLFFDIETGMMHSLVILFGCRCL